MVHDYCSFCINIQNKKVNIACIYSMFKYVISQAEKWYTIRLRANFYARKRLHLKET